MAVSASGTRDLVQASGYERGNKFVSSYETNEGILALPLAEVSAGGAPVEFVRVHQPIRKRFYEFNESKLKTPPLIPAPQDNDKEYLLSSQMNFPLPSVNADRSSLSWQASGKMEFIEKGSWTISTGYRIGNFPILDTPFYLTGLALVAGAAAALAIENETFGETLANNLEGWPVGGSPTNPSYTNTSYDYAPHFPSRFMVADLALGN